MCLVSNSVKLMMSLNILFQVNLVTKNFNILSDIITINFCENVGVRIAFETLRDTLRLSQHSDLLRFLAMLKVLSSQLKIKSSFSSIPEK